MKKWIRYFILFKPVRWTIAQLIVVTMLFTIISTVVTVDQRTAKNRQADAANQGYSKVLDIKVNHVSDYDMDDKSYYLIESDTKYILLSKDIIFHDDIHENQELTVFYKDSETISIQHEQQSADLLDAHSAMTDKLFMRIIWYIAFGLWATAMLVNTVTLTVIDLKVQRDIKKTVKESSNKKE